MRRQQSRKIENIALFSVSLAEYKRAANVAEMVVTDIAE
jgi:hypothetical protein